MATRYWVGNSGTWSTLTTNWSNTSGGAGGAPAPTLNDDVIIDANSATLANTVITVSGATCNSLTFNTPGVGVTISLAGTGNITTYGRVSILTTGAFPVRTSGTWTFAGNTTTKTANIDLGSALVNCNITIQGSNTTYVLERALTQNTSRTFTLSNGSFISNGYTLSIGGFTTSGATGTTDGSLFDIRNSTVTINGTSTTFADVNFVYRTANSNLILAGLLATFNIAAKTYSFNDITFYGRYLNSNPNGINLGPNTTLRANTLTIVNISANTGAVALTAANGGYFEFNKLVVSNTTNMRPQLIASSYQYWDFAVNAATVNNRTTSVKLNTPSSGNNVFFNGIRIHGRGAPFTGNRIGNVGRNSGITFTAAKQVFPATTLGTVTVLQNNFSDSWGGAVLEDYIPLPQDEMVTYSANVLSAWYLPSLTIPAGYINKYLTYSNAAVITGNINLPSPTFSAGNHGGTLFVVPTNDVLILNTAGFGFAFNLGTNNGMVIDADDKEVRLTSNLVCTAGYNTGTTSSRHGLFLHSGTFNTNGSTANLTSLRVGPYRTGKRKVMFGNSTINFVTSPSSLSSPWSATGADPTYYQIDFTGAGAETDIDFGTSTFRIATFGPGSVANPCTWIIAVSENIKFANLVFNANLASGTNRALFLGNLKANNLTITPSTPDNHVNFEFYIANNVYVDNLTATGQSAINRIIFQPRPAALTNNNLTVITAGSASLTDVDFQNIIANGAAAPFSGTRIGNRGNNQNITFSTPKTVYWNLTGNVNWTANAFALSSGGSPNNLYHPLPQDTVVIDNTGAATRINLLADYPVSSINASARTTTVGFGLANASAYIHGSLRLGTGVTINNTTTNVNLIFTNSNTVSRLDTAGVNLATLNIVVDKKTSNLILDSAVSQTSGSILLNSGRFNTNGYSLTTGAIVSNGTVLNTLASNTTNTAWVHSDTNFKSLELTNSTVTILAANAYSFNTDIYTIMPFPRGSNVVFSNGTVSSGAQVRFDKALDVVSHAGTVNNQLILGLSSGGGAPGISTLRVDKVNSNSIIYIDNPGISVGNIQMTGNVTYQHRLAAYVSTGYIRLLSTNSSINYANVFNIDSRLYSPFSLYAGPNSTVSAGSADVFASAQPTGNTYYWVGGAGTWSNTSSTNWSLTSGGTGGAGVPTSLDNLIFDANSSAASYEVQVLSTVKFKDATIGAPASGTVTFTGSQAMFCTGNFNVTGNTSTVNFNFTSSSSAALNFFAPKNANTTITTNGVPLFNNALDTGNNMRFRVHTLNSTVQLGSALTVNCMTVVAGKFQLNGYNFTTRGLAVGNNSLSYNLGVGGFGPEGTYNTLIAGNNATITTRIDSGALSINVATIDYQINQYVKTEISLGSSGILVIDANSYGSSSPQGNTVGNTFAQHSIGNNIVYDGTVAFEGLGWRQIGDNTNVTFTNLRVGYGGLSIANNVVLNVTGTLSANSDPVGKRPLFQSTALGERRSINVASFDLTDVIFRDFSIGNNVATGTRIGDAGNNSNITFSAARSVYYVNSGNTASDSNSYSSSSGGSIEANSYPLPQDKVIVDDNSPNTFFASNNIWRSSRFFGGLDSSARTTSFAYGYRGAFPTAGHIYHFANVVLGNTTTVNTFTGSGNRILVGSNATVSVLPGASLATRGFTLIDSASFVSNATPTNNVGAMYCLSNGTISGESIYFGAGIYSGNLYAPHYGLMLVNADPGGYPYGRARSPTMLGNTNIANNTNITLSDFYLNDGNIGSVGSNTSLRFYWNTGSIQLYPRLTGMNGNNVFIRTPKIVISNTTFPSVLNFNSGIEFPGVGLHANGFAAGNTTASYRFSLGSATFRTDSWEYNGFNNQTRMNIDSTVSTQTSIIEIANGFTATLSNVHIGVSIGLFPANSITVNNNVTLTSYKGLNPPNQNTYSVSNSNFLLMYH